MWPCGQSCFCTHASPSYHFRYVHFGFRSALRSTGNYLYLGMFATRIYIVRKGADMAQNLSILETSILRRVHIGVFTILSASTTLSMLTYSRYEVERGDNCLLEKAFWPKSTHTLRIIAIVFQVSAAAIGLATDIAICSALLSKWCSPLLVHWHAMSSECCTNMLSRAVHEVCFAGLFTIECYCDLCWASCVDNYQLQAWAACWCDRKRYWRPSCLPVVSEREADVIEHHHAFNDYPIALRHVYNSIHL